MSVASLHSLPFNCTVRPSPKLVDEANPKRYMDTDFRTFLAYVSSREPKKKDFLESRKVALNWYISDQNKETWITDIISWSEGDNMQHQSWFNFECLWFMNYSLAVFPLSCSITVMCVVCECDQSLADLLRTPELLNKILEIVLIIYNVWWYSKLVFICFIKLFKN